MNIIDAMDDENLFGPFFRGSSWGPWRVVLKAIFALPMNECEAVLFDELSGGRTPPESPCTEAWMAVGRRGGKSRIMALIAVYLACFREYADFLAPGEVALIPVVAADREQAKTILRYVRAMLQIPLLKPMLDKKAGGKELAERVELNNRVHVTVSTASYRAQRGYTLAAFIGDEVAFWRNDEDSRNPDHEIIAAVRPGLLTIPGALLLGASSPYRRQGVLFEALDKNFGRDGETLAIKAPSRTMNPTLRETEIARAYERDPVAAASEYGAEFRNDISNFLEETWLASATLNRSGDNLPPREGIRYFAFVDPSGGRSDSFTLAISHRDGSQRVVDALIERKPPFAPSAVAMEFAAIALQYGCRHVTGDRYAAGFAEDAFRAAGVAYKAAEKAKSEIYLEALPAFASNDCSIPRIDKLLSQLRGLERKTARGGRDSIDHLPNSHDDLANATCGALWLCSKRPTDVLRINGISGDKALDFVSGSAQSAFFELLGQWPSK